ncbi:MAG: WD40/YVTN/BNR-like repeat-containing protein [Gemmatimonadales bacterium]
MSRRSPPPWCFATFVMVLLTAGALAAQTTPHPAGPDRADRLSGLRARSIGPAGMSGRITGIEAVAVNPGVVFVSAATGGVWKSTNGGLTWQSLFDDQPVHSVGALAVFQPSPDIVWVGSGEGNPRNSASVGNGVYRTADGGKTWRHLGLEKTERIHRVILHPSDPEVAWVCALGQEWGENPDRGVFKTTDGGRTWTKALYVNEKTGCGDLVADPANPQKLIAAMWQFRRWPWLFKSGGPGSGLYVTHDGGATWRRLQEEDGLPKGELGRSGIAISRSNPQVVYALVEAEKSALLRSDDGGRTWRTVNERTNVAPRPFYFADIRVDPVWPNRVYSLDYGIRVSDDGGKTFGPLSGTQSLHGDFHAMWIDPTDPNHLFTGDDGGIGESRDRGRTFRFVGNLPLAQFYHVAVDNETPYNVYGGLQDNGSWRGPNTVWRGGGVRNYDWKLVGGGDGFDTRPNPADATQGYSLWQGGNLMRWNIVTGEERIVKPAPAEGVRLRFNWNAGLATDPFAPNTVYLGSQLLHRSTDRGETWQVISGDLTTNRAEWQRQDQSGGLTPDVTNAENFTTIISVAPSPAERGVLWVGTDDGRLSVSRDSGKTWTSVEANVKGVPPNTWIPHVKASPLAGGTAFVVFDNHRRSDWTPYVVRTDDYGRTWQSLATPDLRGYCLSIEQDPVNKDLLFLGTEFGLYVSWDGGRRWTPLKKTIPTASVMDLVVHPRDHDLVIGTHGRAVWVLDDIRPLRALSEQALAEPLRLFEVADARQYWSAPEEGGFATGSGEFRGQARAYGAIITYSLNLPGLPRQDEEAERARKEEDRRKGVKPDTARPDQVEIQIADAAGKVIRTFKGPAKLGVNRAVWNLRRDGFRQLPRPEDQPPPDEPPSGPEVAPGTYTVTVRFAGREAKQTAKVLPDPRSKNTADDWARRYAAILQAGAVYEAATDAVWLLRNTRDDINTVQQKVRQDAAARGETDPKKIGVHPLVQPGDKVKEGLTALEKRLWQSPETKGIPPETDVMSQIFYAQYFVESSWDPPSPTQLEFLRQARAKLDALLTELNRYFTTEVAAYGKQVADAGVGLLPAREPLTITPRGGP